MNRRFHTIVIPHFPSRFLLTVLYPENKYVFQTVKEDTLRTFLDGSLFSSLFFDGDCRFRDEEKSVPSSESVFVEPIPDRVVL